MAGLGSSLADFEVLDLLGKGGFAHVLRARSRHTGDLVALKLIDKTLPNFHEVAGRVRSEVEIHFQLKHPSILELFTCFENERNVCLVLELAGRGHLMHHISDALRRPFTMPEAQLAMTQVVKGLQYLHAHGIMHRDLTATNILVTDTGDMKISDFGLAARLQSTADTNMTMCGTANFIAPEIVTRSRHGLASDLFSLGCLLFFMVAGRAPFEATGSDAFHETLQNVASVRFTVPDSVPEDAADLIHHLLRKDPRQRISLSVILKHTFFVKPHGVGRQHEERDEPTRLSTHKHEQQFQQQYEPEVHPQQHQLYHSRQQQQQQQPQEQPQPQPPIAQPQTTIAQSQHPDSFLSESRPPPLSTARLRALDHNSRNAAISILADGTLRLVVVGRDGQDETMLISRNGSTINIAKHSRSSSYDLEELPEKYFNKYKYASYFVDLVRAKTPKVTLFTDQAKCMLMENLPWQDFDVRFYAGAKLTVTAERATLIDEQGATHSLDNSFLFSQTEDRLVRESASLARLLKHARESWQVCKRLESTHETLSSHLADPFPLTMGRRRHASAHPPADLSRIPSRPVHTTHSQQQAQSQYSPPPSLSSLPLGSFKGGSVAESRISSTTTRRIQPASATATQTGQQSPPRRESSSGAAPSSAKSERQSVRSQGGTTLDFPGLSARILRSVFIPAHGWAFFLASGETWVLFSDGVQLVLSGDAAAASIGQQDLQQLIRYELDSALPPSIKERIGRVALFVAAMKQHAD